MADDNVVVDNTSNAEAIKVVVRIRPLNPAECQKNATNVVKVESNSITLQNESVEQQRRDVTCHYDAVYNTDASQEDLYQYVCDSVRNVALGINATILAYGQTGTGKSYTMLGDNVEENLESLSSPSKTSWGIIPRAISGLFTELDGMKENKTTFVIQCSYVQIYNNNVYDLLSGDTKKKSLLIKESDKETYVSGVGQFRVESLSDVLQLLKTGGRNRQIRATEMNEASSRSHAVLTLTTEVKSNAEECATVIRRAKLNLVDLAGSEKWNTVETSGHKLGKEHQKELTNINQSLSALGNVISALSERRRSHIPYRDSKLTRLLQDSLGGNTRTTVIATISPASSAVEESVSTLQFADRAKRVMTRVSVNEMVDDAVLLARAQKEITRLKVLLSQHKSEEALSLESKVTKLTGQMQSLRKENMTLQRRIDKLKKKSTSIRPASSGARKELKEEFEWKKMKQELGKNTYEKEILHQNELIEKIQAEKKVLEAELGPEVNDISDDEPCPMCNRAIDDHTDAELDSCIDAETHVEEEKEEVVLKIPKKKQRKVVQKKLRNSAQDIGSKLSVYKYRYDAWYKCTVVGYDSDRQLHCVQYDSGDKNWADFSQKQYKVLVPSSSSKGTNQKTTPRKTTPRKAALPKKPKSAAMKRMSITKSLYNL